MKLEVEEDMGDKEGGLAVLRLCLAWIPAPTFPCRPCPTTCLLHRLASMQLPQKDPLGLYVHKTLHMLWHVNACPHICKTKKPQCHFNSELAILLEQGGGGAPAGDSFLSLQ